MLMTHTEGNEMAQDFSIAALLKEAMETRPEADVEIHVTCSICEELLPTDGGDIADHFVYKCGELQYIELAHTACAKKWNEAWQNEPYWDWGQDDIW